MTVEPQVEKLRQAVIAGVDDLTRLQQSFNELEAAVNLSKSKSIARDLLRARAAREAASEEILKRAATVENLIDDYRTACDRWYAASIEQSTIESRKFYAQLAELQSKIVVINQRILEATEKEKPDVDRIVEENDFHFSCLRGMAETTAHIVRLTDAAVAA